MTSSTQECASVAHGPFGCHLKDKCVLRGEEQLGLRRTGHSISIGALHLELRLVLPGVAQGYSSLVFDEHVFSQLQEPSPEIANPSSKAF